MSYNNPGTGGGGAPREALHAPASRRPREGGEGPAAIGSVGDVVRMLRRHVPLMIALFTLITGSAIVLTLFMYFQYPTYRAEATVIVDPGVGGVTPGGIRESDRLVPVTMVEQFIIGQLRRISSTQVLSNALSPEKAEEMVRDLDPYMLMTTEAFGPKVTKEQVAEKIRSRAQTVSGGIRGFLKTGGDPAVALRDTLKVDNVFRSNLILVSLEGRDRQLITDIVNSVVDSYMLAYQGDRRDRESRLLRGLNDQLAVLRPQVQNAVQRLEAFKREADTVNLSNRRDEASGELRILEEEKTRADLFNMAAQIMFAQLKSQEDQNMISADQERIVQTDPGLLSLKNGETELLRRRTELLERVMPEHEAVKSLDSQIQGIRNQLEARTGELRSTLIAQQKQKAEMDVLSAQDRLKQITKAYETAHAKAIDLSLRSDTYKALEDDVGRLRKALQDIEDAKRTTEIEMQVSANSVSIRNPAVLPEREDRAGPKLALFLPGSVLLGLLVSFGMVMLVEFIDNRVRTPLEVIRVVQTSMLAAVPDRSEDETTRKIENLPLVSMKAPQSLMAESFRQLRTSLLYSTNGELKTLLITSPKAEEGKTVVAVNLASTLAAGGSRVLLIDANFRRSMLHRVFDLPNSTGLSSVLARLNTLEEAIQRTTVANVDVLTCGPLPPSPADLLGSEGMQNLLTAARQLYDNVVIDGAPVLVVTDTHVLCSMVDGVVMVLSSTKTPRGVAIRCKRTLQDLKGRLVGSVLNGVRAQKGGYFREAYKSYYEYAGAPADSTKGK